MNDSATEANLSLLAVQMRQALDDLRAMRQQMSEAIHTARRMEATIAALRDELHAKDRNA